jgi:uncharacterized membrane protein
MNAAYLHITLVHLPIVLIPTAAVLLAIGLWRKNTSLTNTALSICVAATLFAIPAFLLGEGAEEVIEHLPGVSEDLIEEHEEIADIAFWLTVAGGLGSILSIGLRLAGSALYKTAVKGVLFILVMASGALTYAAYEGGKIRHPEAHSTTSASSEAHEDND